MQAFYVEDSKLPVASTSEAGITRLSDTVPSDSLTEAATIQAVSKAFYLAVFASNVAAFSSNIAVYSSNLVDTAISRLMLPSPLRMPAWLRGQLPGSQPRARGCNSSSHTGQQSSCECDRTRNSQQGHAGCA
jgi:hypothetical protein